MGKERIKIKRQIKSNQSDSKSHNAHQKTLMFCSAFLWLISLFMVGFYANDAIYGFNIFMLLLKFLSILPKLITSGYSIFMLFKLVFVTSGLAGWAIFANFIYLWILFKLMYQKKPWVAPVLMILLASLAFTLREIPDNNGNMVVITSWGHGAFVWGFALILMFAAVFDERKFRSYFETILPYAIVLITLFSSLMLLKHWQWQNANSDERKRLFVKNAALNVFKPSGIAYHQPPEYLPDMGQVMEIVGNVQSDRGKMVVVANDIKFKLPDVFVYQGYLIDTQTNNHVVISPNTIKTAYRYEITTTHNGRAVQSLYDVAQNQEIWRSEVMRRVYQNRNHLNDTKYPDFDDEMAALWSTSTPFPVAQWQNAAKMDLPKQTWFTQKCPVQPIPDVLKKLSSSIEKDYLNLDNKIAYLRQAEHNDNAQFWCNEDWIAVLRIAHHENLNIIYSVRFFDVAIHQRNNFAHIATFRLPNEERGHIAKPLFEKYSNDAINHIQSIELNGNHVFLKHPLGETFMPKNKP